jgi:hypothetical protein
MTIVLAFSRDKLLGASSDKTACRIICKLPLVGSEIHAMLTNYMRKVQGQWDPGDMQMHGVSVLGFWHVLERHYKIERVISGGSGMRMTQEENEVCYLPIRL